MDAASNHEQASTIITQLQSRFALTRAEARLVHAFLEHSGPLSKIAHALGITHSTARSQLASVFTKMNINSQVELVRVVTRIEMEAAQPSG